jgi:hypothetical protein
MVQDRDRAIAFANLKGSKDKDLIKTAEALQRLKSHYGSNSKVGEELGVSGEIVRQFLTLLKLPQEFRELFDQRLLGLEHGRRLWQLARRRPHALSDAAKEIQGMTALDGRAFVIYLLAHPELTAHEARQRVIDSKTTVTREFHVIALLSEKSFQKLRRHAKRLGKSVDQTVTSIVEDWLLANEPND